MKNKMRTRITALSIIITMLFSMMPVLGMEYQMNDSKFSNGLIEYRVDKKDGRFIIRTVDGSPYIDTDNDKKLLFDKNNDPETSFTSFVIDGKEYIFGNEYGFLNEDDGFIKVPNNVGNVNTSIWKVDGIVVTQKIELVEDKDHPNIGNVKIRYEIVNENTIAKNIGSRILLDTMLGANDGSAVVLGNTGDIITNETVLMREDIPSYWRCSDDLFTPKVVSYGFTKGWGNPAPDKMIVAHWNNLAETKWDYQVDPNLDFTSEHNQVGTKDSAVALYWNEEPLNPGETRTIETYYGLGDLSNYDSNSTFIADLISPNKVTVNSQKDGYEENKFQVSVDINNNLLDSEILTNITAKLITRPEGFVLSQGETQEKTIAVVNKGSIATLYWDIEPVNQDNYISEPIKVEITSDNNSQPVVDVNYILLPSVQGEPPSIQILSTAPEKIYFQGDKYITIKGNGFLYFNDKSIWKMFLIDEAGKKYEVPKENIDVVGDQKINISLLDGQIEDEMKLGKYSISMVHDDLEKPVNIPDDKQIIFTDDINYRARSYGVLYIEKRELNSEFKYYINTIDSKEYLDNIKAYLKTNDEQPTDYETTQETASKGELKEIVFDIVGDINMTTDQTTNQNLYKINTNNQSAIINSVLIFEDAKKPIEIKKVDDLILINGKGTLQLLNYGEIWWSGFDTFIADGTDYNINKIKEDEDEFENITIALFDYLSLATNVASLFIDGFEMELRDIIMLDEGASLGGKLEVKIPIGTKDESTATPPTTDTPTTDEPVVDEEAEIGEALYQMFMTDEEKEEEKEEEKKSEQLEEKRKTQKVKNAKLRALLLNDSEMYDAIMELIKSKEPTSTKIEKSLSLVMKSKELITKLTKVIKGEDKEEEKDKKSVGVAIDVKKVIFGKKYGADFVYDDVKYIGIEGKGNVNISIPGLDSGSTNKGLGIAAKLNINSLDGIYSLDADVDIKLAEAHAFITIMRLQDSTSEESRYVLDDLVLSGGFMPGIPIAPPIFINKVGGGVENLYGVITDDDSSPPLNVVVILGLNIVPSFQGDFTLKASKEGFSLDGSFEIAKLKVIDQASIELRWARPVYLALKAHISAFEIIEGGLSIYIGEIETGNSDKPYEFFLEGKANVEIGVPNKIPIAGGMKFTEIELGVSTQKMWGNLKVGFIPIGMTWVYKDGFSFGKLDNMNPEYAYASLTDVIIPDRYWNTYDVHSKEGDMNLIFGSNISVIGSSNYQYASIGDFDYNTQVLASIDRKTHNYNFQNLDMGLIELTFVDTIPEVALTDPNGNRYPLVSIEDDSINGNYIVQTIAAEDSESGNTENYVYIGIKNPMNGTWVLESNQMIDSKLMDVKIPPEFNGVNMGKNVDNTLKITWDASHAEDSLVSLFLLNKNEIDGAGYALVGNIDGTKGAEGVSVDIPKGIEEGDYVVRATIQHPLYGYESTLTDNFITIVDLEKPAKVNELNTELYGNGFIKSTWNPINEEGIISYFVTVYDSLGNPVEGYTDLEVMENSVVLGGSYKDSNTGNIVSLISGNEYTVGITSKKILNESDDTRSIHLGVESISNKVLLRNPTPPEIETIYSSNPIQAMSKNYFNSNEINIEFITDQTDVNTTVYLDGEYFINFNNPSYKLFFDLDDGEHKVKFVSENKYRDRSSKTLLFNVDTTPPELKVDSPLPGFISDTGLVSIKGTAENGSQIKINGVNVDLGANDLFEGEYVIPVNKLKDNILIEAIDYVGNTTTYSTEVTNGKIGFFEEIKIKPVINEILSGEKMEFSIVGVDDKLQEVEINSSNVEWSIIEGNSLAEISEDGVFTANEAGDIVLKASYYISEDYSYDDAIEFQILDNIEYVYMWPYISSIQIGDSVNLSLYEASKYSENFVDNGIVDWRIVSGESFASIDEFGHLKALKVGKTIVSGSYTDRFGNEHVLESEINVTKEPTHSNNNDSNNDIDVVIGKIWISLVQTEKNITIENIVDISEGSQRKLSVRGIAEIEVPVNTVSGKDQLFIGTINDPEKLIPTDKFVSHSEIIELQLKEAVGKLNNPIKVTFKFRGSNETNKNIGVYYFNPRFHKWQYLGGKVDIEKGTVEIELNHLSKYAVLEKKEENDFKDISNRWSTKYIESISSLDIVNGEQVGEDKYFRPTRLLTRLEFSAMIVRILEKMYDEIPKKASFDDNSTFIDYESTKEWGKEYIQKAYEYGLIKGIEKDGSVKFMPNKNITRAEVITVLGRILEMNSTVLPPSNDFTDKAQIPTWADEYVDLLQYSGLLTGYSDGTVRVYKNIAREEIAKMCFEWIEYRDIEIKKN